MDTYPGLCGFTGMCIWFRNIRLTYVPVFSANIMWYVVNVFTIVQSAGVFGWHPRLRSHHIQQSRQSVCRFRCPCRRRCRRLCRQHKQSPNESYHSCAGHTCILKHTHTQRRIDGDATSLLSHSFFYSVWEQTGVLGLGGGANASGFLLHTTRDVCLLLHVLASVLCVTQ